MKRKGAAGLAFFAQNLAEANVWKHAARPRSSLRHGV